MISPPNSFHLQWHLHPWSYCFIQTKNLENKLTLAAPRVQLCWLQTTPKPCVQHPPSSVYVWLTSSYLRVLPPSEYSSVSTPLRTRHVMAVVLKLEGATWRLIKTKWLGPTTRASDEQVWGGAWEFMLLFLFLHLYWGIIALQCCVSFCGTSKWISYMYKYIPISPPSWASLPPSLSHPSRSSQSTEMISLCHVAASH